MLGLVNKGIYDLALELGGEQLWRDISAAAGVPAEDFLSMSSYSDDITYQLIAGASSVLGISQSEVLEAFGRHWILYTARGGYGQIFDTMGRSLPEFLANLNAMHTRLSLSMPKLHPPSFICDQLSEHRLRLEYWSDRPGLAPMVVGLLTGLGEKFGLDLVVKQTADRSTGVDHDEFIVDYWPLGSGPTPAAPRAEPAPPTSALSTTVMRDA